MVLATLGPVTSASATVTTLCTGITDCTNKGYSDYGYQAKRWTSYWGMYGGNNCTNYIAYRFVTRKYDSMSNTRPWSGDGNAYSWKPNNASKSNTTPRVGAVAWWPASSVSPTGHVAHVEKVVSSSEIWVSESNWGQPDSTSFKWKKITSSSGWPSAFIHFKDEDLNVTTNPTITGTPKVGVKLTASKGTWKSSSGVTPRSTVTHKYQWYASGSAISGATASTYTPTSSVRGNQISVKVSVSASGYLGSSKTSALTGAVAYGTLTSTSVPVISGVAKVDSTLKVSNGGWTPTPSSYTYQWNANGAPISGATKSSYVVQAADVGKTITAKVTAAASGYTSLSKTTAATATVASGALTNTAAPTIEGVAEVDQTLTAVAGSWTPSPSTVSYQWNADGVAIPDATQPTYQVSAADLDKVISVSVTATKAGYSTSNVTCAGTAAVSPAQFTMVTGGEWAFTSDATQVATAILPTWSPQPEASTIQWYFKDEPIDGATGLELLMTNEQYAEAPFVFYIQTVTKDGYVSATSNRASVIGIG